MRRGRLLDDRIVVGGIEFLKEGEVLRIEGVVLVCRVVAVAAPSFFSIIFVFGFPPCQKLVFTFKSIIPTESRFECECRIGQIRFVLRNIFVLEVLSNLQDLT